MDFKELSAEEVTELRGNTRQVGAYRTAMEQFVASGLSGADVTDQFTGRKASSVAQALKKIAKRDYEGVVEVLHVNRDGAETVALIRSQAATT